MRIAGACCGSGNGGRRRRCGGDYGLNTPQAILANLLTGTATAGAWIVQLGTSDNTGGPCGQGGGWVCELTQSGSYPFYCWQGFGPGAPTRTTICVLNYAVLGNFFANLQVGFAPTTGGATPNVVQLSGQATSNATSTISYVETDLYTCGNFDSQGVFTGGLSTIAPSSCFTSGPELASASGMLTSATSFPGSPGQRERQHDTYAQPNRHHHPRTMILWRDWPAYARG
jgi:hypothetical protein